MKARCNTTQSEVSGILLCALTVGFFLFPMSCTIDGTKATTQESYGDSHKDNNYIKWIPSWVVDQDGKHDKSKEQIIAKNIKEASFASLKDQGLFNTQLLNFKKEDQPWSSGFFPSWFDGVAGRWSKGKLSELRGYKLRSKESILATLKQAKDGDQKSTSFLFSLSPMEKYDIATSDYNFGSTKRELALRGHKSLFIPFWNGYCNGVSIAATVLKEPFRKVTVVNPDGQEISFHPYDVKGLLGLAYYSVDYDNYARIGSRCEKTLYDPFFDITGGRDDDYNNEPDIRRETDKNCRGVNPATLVLTLQNRLGIAKQSFVVDKYQDHAVSNHPIGEAQIDILKDPYTYKKPSSEAFAAEGTTHLVDVRIKLWLGSTALADSKAVNRVKDAEVGLYKTVGFVPEKEDNPKKYYATLELDKNGKIIGGEWGIKDRWGTYQQSNEAPDFAWFGLKPLLIDQSKAKETLGLQKKELEEAITHNRVAACRSSDHNKNCDGIAANPAVRWSIIKAIYEKSILSIEESPETPLLYLP